ncbi:radical SAM protein [Candidatus Microgenomates bacterium]|nr:radical SAM protein [Candidatus Microgenomates bacterium]
MNTTESLSNFSRSDAIRSVISPDPGKLRYVNWYLQHGCDLSCEYCATTQHPTRVMSSDQRKQVLASLKRLSVEHPMLGIIGGEPLLDEKLLVGAVEDATNAGFIVQVVTNGNRLNNESITRLGQAGLRYLSVSVDSGNNDKGDLSLALANLAMAKGQGIVAVINSVISRQTDPEDFKRLTRRVIGQGFFLSPVVCSPERDGGSFSGADIDDIPSPKQIKEIVPWLAWQKLKTGRITASFGTLNTLFALASNTTGGQTALWHCSPHFRGIEGGRRGTVTLDSDGFIGPCQEFPRQKNILSMTSGITVELLDPTFTDVTRKCPGCLYACYMTEEQMKGLNAIAEVPRGLQMSAILFERGGR